MYTRISVLYLNCSDYRPAHCSESTLLLLQGVSYRLYVRKPMISKSLILVAVCYKVRDMLAALFRFVRLSWSVQY